MTTTISAFNTACGTCVVQNGGPHSNGIRLFKRGCEGWAAPISTTGEFPAVMAAELANVKFVVKPSLADSLNQVFAEQDKVRVYYHPKWN